MVDKKSSLVLNKGLSCAFITCDQPAHSKGLCKGHYLQQWHGKPLSHIQRRGPNRGGSCSIMGCGAKHYSHGLCRKHAHWKREFGINPQLYEDILASQGGVCAICRGACNSGRAMALDHDHETGMIRGVLCHKCNRGIGLLRDDPNLLRAAANYLEASRSNIKVA